jgi:hypothetical protein
MRWSLALKSGNDLKAAMSTALLLTLMAVGAPAVGQPDLGASVTVIGASAANDALTIPATTGKVSLVLLVKNPSTGHLSGELRTLPFSTQDQSPAIATAKIRIGGSAPATESALISLDRAGQIPFSLEFDRLRPEKTYRGQLILSSGDLVHPWTLTVTTGGRGQLAVDPVGVLKFVALRPFNPSHFSFSFTLRDKSESGPYSHLRARFQPAGASSSKTIASNFSLDSISFGDKDVPLDLFQRNEGGQGSGTGGLSLTRERTFTAWIEPLAPGEYSGTLQFAADDTADDAADAKLPLVIQVRHHWWLPIFVIFLGSAFGWFASKFIVGKRKVRQWAQKVKGLRARAEFLAHTSAPRSGWEFPCEGISLGYARAGVALSRLAKQAASTMEIIIHGDEIEELGKSIEFRLSALESLRDLRLRVQPAADGRPAAQLAIGRLLRHATNLLEGLRFEDLEQTALTKDLGAIAKWADAATFGEMYRQAIIDRRKGSECPEVEDVQGYQGPARTQLDQVMKLLPDEPTISQQTTPADLRRSDQLIARVALLWRERDQAWVGALVAADAGGKSLEELFYEVDMGYWNLLMAEVKAGHFEIERESAIRTPLTYEVIEMYLNPQASDLKVDRMRRHPMRVVWEIQSPGGKPRAMETDGLTLVQYFPSKGLVTVQAFLCWANIKVPAAAPLSFQVELNPDYDKTGLLPADWTEYMAIGMALLFASVTGMVSQYDSTFGSVNQYLALFLWAAGAGTGGNLFSQLGSESAPGGQAKIGFS